MTSRVMGIDQHGHTFHDIGPHPRKRLMAIFGTQHAERMFMEYKSGPPKHIGYVVRDHWVTLYNVEEWEGKHGV